MKTEITDRGFKTIHFEDSYREKCTLQKSSSAFEPKVWLGITSPKLVVFENEDSGKYIISEMPKTFQVNARMHLSMQQVKALLPYLQKFVETGDL